MTFGKMTMDAFMSIAKDGLTWATLAVGAALGQVVESIDYFQRPMTVAAIVSLMATFIMHLLKAWVQTRDQSIQALRATLDGQLAIQDRELKRFESDRERWVREMEESRTRWQMENRELQTLIRELLQEKRESSK